MEMKVQLENGNEGTFKNWKESLFKNEKFKSRMEIKVQLVIGNKSQVRK